MAQAMGVPAGVSLEISVGQLAGACCTVRLWGHDQEIGLRNSPQTLNLYRALVCAAEALAFGLVRASG